ncbi:hypothetical protein C900_00236 [Fulvivirga imtechensis AK7]|uniref:Uncharacterized protein n=1 Tax=Fulvivirga imtechensis AK7 TaxID=1237149 RepID=L8JK00_9BACT|nr:hypothetical protein C900_00236 [Fulvivirga imtechensis AK7]
MTINTTPINPTTKFKINISDDLSPKLVPPVKTFLKRSF